MSDGIKVVALTAGRSVPSARFRVEQYREPIRTFDIDLDWHPAPISKYPPHGTIKRAAWLFGCVAARIPGVLASHGADVTLFGRELVSTLMTLEGLTHRPRVLDVDDAIWLTQRAGSIERIAGCVDAVMAGNDYVAEWFARYCDDVVVVPTAVDTERFRPSDEHLGDDVLIGWTGTSGNLKTLDEVWPALGVLMKERENVRILITSDRRPRVPHGLADRVDYVSWSPGNEVSTIQKMDVGLMPLFDDEWSRGKCSYKMLLYMSCGIPVVISPVGMNAQVLGLGDVGCAADDVDSWLNALVALVDDVDLRRRQGAEGRRIVEANFSRTRVASDIADILKRVAGR